MAAIHIASWRARLLDVACRRAGFDSRHCPKLRRTWQASSVNHFHPTPPPPLHHFGYSVEGDYMLLDKVSLGATRTPLRAGGGGAKAGVGAAELLASGMTVPSSCCPQPRQPQLRVERALAHSARRSKGLRPAARLSAGRQRAALHSPPTLILPPQHGMRGRIALCCRGPLYA